MCKKIDNKGQGSAELILIVGGLYFWFVDIEVLLYIKVTSSYRLDSQHDHA